VKSLLSLETKWPNNNFARERSPS